MNNTENQSRHSMSVENANASLLKKRRDFIKKTSAAVPVILTLRSGSVLAAESATCAVKLRDPQNGPAKTAQAVTTSKDIWLRADSQCAQVQKLVTEAYTDNDGVKHDAVYDDPKDVYFAPLINSSGHGWFEYDQDNAGNPYLSTDELKPDGTVDEKKLRVVKSLSNCYVLQQVDEGGKLTGIVGPSSALAYSTDSCVASLAIIR